MFQFLLIFITLAVFDCTCNETPIVALSLGQIEGFVQKSYNGKPFASFEGVPYAKPPIDDLRFRDPLPVEPWKVPLKALKPFQCLQLHFPNNALLGQEDCLYLNIYVPNTKPDRSTNYDVLVHIHGGAFVFGSGDDYAQPHFLMDREVILITINYRLGIFGFLSTKDEQAPGNYGMKDQVLALKWIKQHIINFGGNPNSITIEGFSAGGASVQYHFLSPLSAGLFHKGISCSGTSLNSWAFQKEPEVKARQLGIFMNCPIDQTNKLINCLRKQPGPELTEKLKQYKQINQPLDPFGPVIDGSFLPDHPYALLRNKKVQNLPWISSTVRNEGILFGLPLEPDLDIVNENFDYYLSVILDYNYTLPESQRAEVTKRIRERYLGGEQKLTSTLMMDLYKAMTDRLFQVDIESAVRLHASAISSPVYFYYYNRLGEHSFTQVITDNDTIYDVAHGDNVLLIYTLKLVTSNSQLTDSEVKMKDALLDFYMNFIKTGKAVFNDIPLTPVDRKKDSDFVYLNITSLDNVEQYKIDRLSPYKFWTDLGIGENNNLYD